MPENSRLRFPRIFDKKELQGRVASCLTCKGNGFANNLMIGAPRFGTGPLDADLMLIGQNPPTDPKRGLHGAWLMHYPDVEKGPHELLVHRLVEYLGLTPKQVFATQTVKCQTKENEKPHFTIARTCALRHLYCEVRDVNPKVILCLGEVAQFNIADACPGMQGFHRDEWSDTVPVGNYTISSSDRVSRWKNVVCAPHPSKVGRFITEQSWLEVIKRHYDIAAAHPEADRLPGFYYELN